MEHRSSRPYDQEPCGATGSDSDQRHHLDPEHTPAFATQSLGSLLPNTAGRLVKVNHYSDARVDKSRGAVTCSTCSINEFAPGSPLGFPRGIFHLHDYMFYYFDLRHNATIRTQHCLNTHSVAHR